MKKKMLSLALALVMCLSLIPCAFAAGTENAADKFTDVPSDAWYLDELEYAVYNGYISGTSADTFSPSVIITRGEFVTILGRMLGVQTNAYTSAKFEDIDLSSWWGPYAAWATENDYMGRYSSRGFGPAGNMEVAQMAEVLDKYIKKTGAALPERPVTYVDQSDVSASAYQSALETASKYDLLRVDPGGHVWPYNLVTRADCVYTLVRLAKGLGLGNEPPSSSRPVAGKLNSFVNQPVLAGKVTSYSDLLPGDYQIINNHAPEDIAAIENNFKYLLKYDLQSIKMIFDANDDWTSEKSLLCRENYLDFALQFSDFGYYGGWVYEGLGVGGDYSKEYKTISFKSQEQPNGIDKYRMDALMKAVQIHDELWASGAIKSTMTQKQKARVYYDWLISHCAYDYEAYEAYGDMFGDASYASSYMTYGALVNGKAVCEGYTGAYNLLLKLEGIECRVEVSKTASHDWTSATLDGVLYHIDPTWGDSSGQANKYFAMTPEASWARFK
ncbi:MAG: hypothetical protein HDT14_06710 [Oscillibacter sp.]|nr:hypothetical protein [Oscillibacter sp.]